MEQNRTGSSLCFCTQYYSSHVLHMAFAHGAVLHINVCYTWSSTWQLVTACWERIFGMGNEGDLGVLSEVPCGS